VVWWSCVSCCSRPARWHPLGCPVGFCVLGFGPRLCLVVSWSPCAWHSYWCFPLRSLSAWLCCVSGCSRPARWHFFGCLVGFCVLGFGLRLCLVVSWSPCAWHSYWCFPLCLFSAWCYCVSGCSRLARWLSVVCPMGSLCSLVVRLQAGRFLCSPVLPALVRSAATRRVPGLLPLALRLPQD